MAKDSFKVKKSLNIKPTDPSTLTNREAGDIIVDSTDNNKLKTYNPTSDSYQSVSTPGGLDTVFVENFESNTASSFTTGQNATPDAVGTGTLGGTLANETSSQISGDRSLKYTMNATASSSNNDFIINDTDIALDAKQKGNFIGVSFYYTYTGADDDIRFFVLDQDDNELTQSDEYIKANTNPTRFSTSVFVPTDDTALRYGFQVVTGNSSKVFIVDDIEFSTNPFVYKNVESFQLYHASLTSTYKINTVNQNEGEDLITVDTSPPVRNISLTAKRDCVVSLNVSGTTNGGRVLIRLFANDNTTEIGVVDDSTTSNHSNNALTYYKLSAGESIFVHFSVFTGTFNRAHLNFKATASSEHVVTPAKSNLTDWELYSPTYTGFGTVSNDAMYYRIVGDTLQIKGSVTAGGTTATTAKMTLPSGYTIDTSKMVSGRVISAGVWFRGNINTPNNGGSINIVSSTTDGVFFSSNQVFSNTSSTASGQANAVGVLGSGQDLMIPFLTIPIVEGRADATFLAAVPVPLTAYLKDVQDSTSAGGGTFTSGAWRTRPLNTISGDSQIVSLSSNQFTLSPGKYEIEAILPANRVDRHLGRLRDITNSATIVTSHAAMAEPAENVTNTVTLMTTLNISSSTTYEVQHACQTTRATDGFGRAHNNFVPGSEDNVYAQVKITKIK